MSKAPVALFPGQGSQREGMSDLVALYRPDLLELLAEAVGTSDPFARVEESTRFLQPAVLCASLAGWARYRATFTEPPSFLAGHSLGELAALAAAGSMSDHDALRVVALRGELMDRVATSQGDSGMVAFMGRAAQDLARRAPELGVALANDNAPQQVVLSGPERDLETAIRVGRDLGLKHRALAIRGAFHHPSLAAVASEFMDALRQIELSPPTVPVFCAVHARPFEDIPTELAAGLVNPVRWRKTMLELHRLGVRSFIEVGPGKVLTGLVRRTLPDVHAESLDQPTEVAVA